MAYIPGEGARARPIRLSARQEMDVRGDATLGVAVGRFVQVCGPSGSGKTTLAHRLAAALGLHAIDLDGLYHRAGWQTESTEEFEARVRLELAAHPEGWVVAGNYSTLRGLLQGQIDTLIWLDLPFRTVYPRVLTRTVRQLVTREELFNGNRESFKRTFFSRYSMPVWVMSSWRRTQLRIGETAAQAGQTTRVFRLRSQRQADEFLCSARRNVRSHRVHQDELLQ